jgi:lambda family phage portal protein
MSRAASILSALERGLDRAIGLVSPGRESGRIAERLRAMQLRQFAAALTTNGTGDWTPVNQDINALIRGGGATIRVRARQLYNDFPFFARAVNNLINFSVGDGIAFQSRVGDVGPDGKRQLNRKAITAIEDARKWWMDECDAAGKLHYFDIERLWRYQDVIDGESIIVGSWDSSPGRYLPLMLQCYEAEWLSSDFAAKASNGAVIDQGVEYDPVTGRVIALHFRVPDGFSQLTDRQRSVRVPAERVLHGFETRRPGQLRGVSRCTPAIMLADNLQEFLGANMDRATMASKWAAIIETTDAAKFQRGRAEVDGATGQRQTVLENATIEFLLPGEKININAADVPGDNFGPTTKFFLQMLAVSHDVPYELVAGDYSGLNYNTTRTVRNDFAKAMRPLVARHCRQFGARINRLFFDALHLTGKVAMPGYATNQRHWMAGIWQPPGQEPLDLLRESRGQIDLVKSLLFSPQEIITGRGRDPEDVLNELQEFKRMAEERGLSLEEVSTAMQTNPAAVAGNPTAPSKQEDTEQ